MNKNEGDDISEDELKPDELIKKSFLEGSSVDITKGDKIRVMKGDLNGVTGTVVALEDNQVIFKPHIEGFDDNLKLETNFVVKYFEPGDNVRVIEGKYRGETGLVVNSEARYVNIALD
jgi:transcription elongation factor